MEKNVKNILIVGVGGQGTLLTSRILADVVADMGYEVTVSEIHGMAQRGGSVVTQVRYGEKVESPIIEKGEADIILAFEKIETARYLDFMKKDGMAIVNQVRIDPLPVLSGKMKYPDEITDEVEKCIANTIRINATEVAEACGNIKVANVVIVGALAAAIGLPTANVEEAIRRRVPAKVVDLNVVAFQKGYQLLKK